MDAVKIYRIMVESFGSRLLYTIYQEPRSALYIAKLITRGPVKSHNYFFVACRSRVVVGYYHAVKQSQIWFLNYIAVTNVARGSGVGQLLLWHFEEIGRALNCDQFMLDVSDSNHRAIGWYHRYQYELLSTSYDIRVPLRGLTESGGPSLRSSWLARTYARWGQLLWGFSKLNSALPDGWLTIGLIGSRTCKLLKYTGVTLEEAARSIACTFWPKRNVLIVSQLPGIPDGWDVMSCEEVLRLVKKVR